MTLEGHEARHGHDATDILLVEDDPDDLELALRALEREGIAQRVRVARDGAEALEVVGELTDALPKVVLLDLKLPKVNGLEVLRRLKEDPKTKAIPVVVLTSSKEDRDVVESYSLGVNSFIRKPVTFEQFADSVAQLGLYWLFLNQPPPAGGS
jgi:two-component system response regulator